MVHATVIVNEQGKVKVILNVDEWYPVLVLSRSGFVVDQVEIDMELYGRWQACIKEFDAIQDELGVIARTRDDRPNPDNIFTLGFNGYTQIKFGEWSAQGPTQEAAYKELCRKHPSLKIPPMSQFSVLDTMEYVHLDEEEKEKE